MAMAFASALKPGTYVSRTEPQVLVAELKENEIGRLRDQGAQVIASHQYQPLSPPPQHRVQSPMAGHSKSLPDVLRHIRADQAWTESRGKGVHIAVVDTGGCGTLAEFPKWKKSPESWAAPGLGDAWTDTEGHGSMTAGIAGATRSAGGRYDGVAPDAVLIACKTTFDDTELYQIYDHLIQLVERKKVGRLVVNNSYGFYQCTPPDVDPGDPFPSIVRTAVSKGIVAVFAAGNNHVQVCHHDRKLCGPNSVWSTNSMDEVMAIGTVNEDNRNDQPPSVPGYGHQDSSRGPGQFAKHFPKPECVAPTYGEVIWGCGYQAMEWWGTSGAAPQVAGLAALMLAKNPALSPDQVRAIIMKTCVPLSQGPTCVGAGLIDCQAAVSLA